MCQFAGYVVQYAIFAIILDFTVRKRISQPVIDLTERIRNPLHHAGLKHAEKGVVESSSLQIVSHVETRPLRKTSTQYVLDSIRMSLKQRRPTNPEETKEETDM